MSDPGAISFPTTQWSLIARAAARIDGVDALDDLLRRYIEPMRRHLADTWRADPETIEDLLQTFIAEKILRQQILALADARRGRFRAFLGAVLSRFASNYFRDARRLKRGAGQIFHTEHLHDIPAPPGTDPANAFDVEWARQVLHQAVRLMQTQCHNAGRADLWAIFEARVVGPTLRHERVVPYEVLIARFSLTSPEQASNLLMTAKRTFARCLRGIIGEYEQDPEDIERELMDLQQILGQAGA